MADLPERKFAPLAAWAAITLMAGVWLVPYLLGASPPQEPHTYEMFGYANYIIESGQIDRQHLRFHAWPTWAIIGSTVALIAKVSPDWIIRITPFAIQMLALLAVLTLPSAEERRPDNVRWLSMGVVFSLANWTHVNALLPQGIAYLFFVFYVVFLGHRWEMGRLAPRELLVALMFLVAIAMSHLLTSIAVVGISAAAAAKTQGRFRILAVLAIVIVFGWSLYWATIVVSQEAFLISKALTILGALREVLFARGGPASGAAYRSVLFWRAGFSLLIAVIATWGFVRWLSGRKDRIGRYFVRVVVGLIPIAFTITGGASASYAVRLYAMLLLPAAFFATTLMNTRAGLLLLLGFILVAVPLNLTAREGLQVWESLNPGYIQGLEFFHDHTRRGTVAEVKPRLYGDPFAFGTYRHRDRYVQMPHTEADPAELAVVTRSPNAAATYYIVVTKMAERIYQEVIGDKSRISQAEEWLAHAHFSLVYENSGVRIWTR